VTKVGFLKMKSETLPPTRPAAPQAQGGRPLALLHLWGGRPAVRDPRLAASSFLGAGPCQEQPWASLGLRPPRAGAGLPVRAGRGAGRVGLGPSSASWSPPPPPWLGRPPRVWLVTGGGRGGAPGLGW
jgi:hypothetical protein